MVSALAVSGTFTHYPCAIRKARLLVKDIEGTAAGLDSACTFRIILPPHSNVVIVTFDPLYCVYRIVVFQVLLTSLPYSREANFCSSTYGPSGNVAAAGSLR